MAGLAFEEAPGIKLKLAVEYVAIDLTAGSQIQNMGEDIAAHDAGEVDFVGHQITSYDRVGLNPEFAARDASLDLSRYNDIIVGDHGAADDDALIDMENLLSQPSAPECPSQFNNSLFQ
ncbi:MAG: hypothetical protein AAGB04_13570 [Pseudomonadota bacterium]